jgi:hypothetical protein
MSWKRQQEFVGRYIRFARHAAWGENLGIPGLDGMGAGTGTATPPVAVDDDPMAQPMNRRQRRMQEKDAKKENKEKKPKGIRAARASPAETPPAGATGAKKRVVAENGKILVVDAVGNVYLEQADEDGETHEFLLDPNELPPPTLRDTALYRVPIWAYSRSAGRFLNKPSPTEESDEEGDVQNTESSDDVEDYEVLEKVKTTAQNGNRKAVRRMGKSAKGR